MKRLDQDQLLVDLRIEARDWIEDRLDRMSLLLGQPEVTPDALSDLRRDAHSLKGLGGSFGFPVVAVVAHRLEDYLGDLTPPVDLQARRDLQVFIDSLQDICVHHLEAGPETIRQIARGLPLRLASFDPAEVEVRDVEIMLVAPGGTATRYVRQELAACGYRVTLVGRPLEALDFALHTRPDLVVVSAILEELDGIDLICALAAMPRTRNLPLALLTSLDNDDDKLRDLPPHVPILHKGAQFSDDVAEVLIKYRII
ncbi:response regulator [Govanella unica]|uniref:Response regulator n=1 Tax=Govanella unica TaxID=2975056 RepID=A0A9X3TW72_9PROT|nr:response regulator [Govania unica]MDA5193115.1 response regulator [Govania unica]